MWQVQSSHANPGIGIHARFVSSSQCARFSRLQPQLGSAIDTAGHVQFKEDINRFVNHIYISELVARYAVFASGELRSARPAGP
jgi:hypothetical protein